MNFRSAIFFKFRFFGKRSDPDEISNVKKKSLKKIKGAFVWDQSGIRIIGIMQVSVCLGAILIPEYLDSILAILLPGAE